MQRYFELDGNVCAFLAAKGHVNLFLYDGAIVADPERIITGATTTAPPGPSRSAKATGSQSTR